MKILLLGFFSLFMLFAWVVGAVVMGLLVALTSALIGFSP